METMTIKRGDTSPALRYALFPSSVILSGATVLFKMRREGAGVVIDAPAAIITATENPTVEYAWAEEDTETSGLHFAEFEVTYSDGSVETFPNNGFIQVSIIDDIR